MSIRSALSRRAIRAAAVAGVAAAALGTAGIASASTAAPHTNGLAPVEECLNWSGTVKYFPALGSTSHQVTAVLSGTLSNCNFQGTPQTFSGSVFGVLTGTATKGASTLTGNVAVQWPQDAQLSPTIAPISLSTSSGTYSFFGTISAGTGTGLDLMSSYDKVSTTKVSGGTQQSIIGASPFGYYINE